MFGILYIHNAKVVKKEMRLGKMVEGWHIYTLDTAICVSSFLMAE